MRDFNIAWIDDNTALDVVCLQFETAEDLVDKIILKNVKFIKEGSNIAVPCENAIWPVYLPRIQRPLYFKYPNCSDRYGHLTFSIKHEGSKGWEVSIDLKSKEILIEEAKYQIL